MKLVLYVLGGVVVLGMMAAAITPNKPVPVAPARVTPPPAPAAVVQPPPQQPPIQDSLIGTSMMAVKRFMKNPDSATFPPSREWTIAVMGQGKWQVRGEVTSTNAFNARVRQPVVVEMYEAGENITVTYVRLGTQVVYGKAGKPE